jgi:hypothetical protein
MSFNASSHNISKASGGGQTWQGIRRDGRGIRRGPTCEAIAVNLPNEAPIRVTFASETPGGSLQEAALRRRQAL